MEESFGKRLAELRKRQGWSQGEVAQMLTERGWSVKTQAVSKWEKDTTLPNAAQFLILCQLYRVHDVQRAFLSEETESTAIRQLPLYTLAVSAGTGQFLDGSSYDLVEAGNEVSAQADFGVRIAGDSMEPRVLDGDVVYVRQQPDVDDGQIAVVGVDDSVTLKVVYHLPNGLQLVSLNPKYKPMIYTQ